MIFRGREACSWSNGAIGKRQYFFLLIIIEAGPLARKNRMAVKM
jgi:hypothetical protein